MTILKCDAEDVLEIARELHKADAGIRQILQVLDVVITEKSASWSGDSHRYFMQFFREWRRGMDIQSYTMRKTAEQLRRASEEYRKLPFEVPQKTANRQTE